MLDDATSCHGACVLQNAPMAWSIDDLKSNRVSTLLYGGSEADRRAFAQAAAQHLGGAFVEAKDAPSVERSLKNGKVVLYVPDVATLPAITQRAVVRTLREHEERPKFVLGLALSPETAFERGALTEDLRFWLAGSTIDVKSRGKRG